MDAKLDSAPATESVELKTSDLVDGNHLQFPIYDKSGVLLLASGSVITARFRELLEARGLQHVVLSRADVEAMVGKLLSSDKLLSNASLDSALGADIIRKLDELIQSGKLFIEDVGPKFRDRFVTHGYKGYARGRKELLIARHAETCTRLDEMIQSAAHGAVMNGGDIARIVAEYLTHLTLDVDCVLSILAHERDYADIAEHCLQSALLAMALAIEMRKTEDTVRVIGLSGLLHEWGMTYVPEKIRKSSRPLSDIEFLEITKHPIHTVNLLERMYGLPPLVCIVCFQAHERPNGTGYPRGRQGNSIHPCARILGVADAYITLTCGRPGRPPLAPTAAVECLIRLASMKLFDPDVVRALLMILSQFPIGSLVELSDGSQARVIRRNGYNYHSPIVQLLERPDGTQVDPADPAAVLDPSQAGLPIIRALSDSNHPDLDVAQTIAMIEGR